MISKDFKRLSIILSTSLTTFFEALINLIPQLSLRQILNPVGILLSIGISIFIMHKVKCYTRNLLIENNEEELKELLTDVSNSNSPITKATTDKINRCKAEILKLKREKSEIDFF